ncbi:uncharacterized protein LOC126857033 isoform X2 [Cataglyphis hispanica]|uniref:uncharacterized protein LOC126857033 isoform X2 n=1 Tax=Cataglyphis hispanica TaxID=1086592 RepID=UPI00217FC0C2|nr:uncharacterized protein LOC126857033 isoform X2 [Cataglyphis hispanica]
MDEEIEKRIAELQKYFPLVKATIEWLQNIKDKDTREFLLRKMQGLHWILSGVPVELTIEKLQQCENALQKMDSIIKSYPHLLTKRWHHTAIVDFVGE